MINLLIDFISFIVTTTIKLTAKVILFEQNIIFFFTKNLPQNATKQPD